MQDSTHVRVKSAQMQTTDTPTYKKSPFAFRKFLNVLKSSLGRNSQFHDLSREDWNKLGSIEYKALKMLLYLVPGYLISCQIIGIFILAPYMIFNKSDVALSNGVAGNLSLFKCFQQLWFIIARFKHGTLLNFLLGTGLVVGSCPSRKPSIPNCLPWFALVCSQSFTNQQSFPRLAGNHHFHFKIPKTTLYIFVSWSSSFSSMDSKGSHFTFLNKNNPALDTLPPHIQFLDAYFQTVVTRTAGFDVIPISSLRIGMQALYLAMMFVSVYPVVFAMRSSNVYEERSLGIYANELLPEKSEIFSGPNYGDEDTVIPHAPRTRAYYLQQEVRKQLGHDLWFPMATAILILWIETGSFDRDPTTFSAFNILFESVSAYAGVGLSTGLQDQAYSLCGEFHIASKLILCLAMLRGRHRGLPVAIDQAVQLPQDVPGEMEQQDHEIRTRFSLVDAALDSRPPFSTRPSDQIKEESVKTKTKESETEGNNFMSGALDK
ncbi:Potassium transport protein [Lachnellula subtilissima]|uniref:Potassium transport protein n=1 Tax=Lachnellula subtilissima TaxID=602034 RepID=A0A8H8U9F3_9HELO|nr:Potassium transport protein [Lachnellula subtilissima]